jgi:hypothetical protein
MTQKTKLLKIEDFKNAKSQIIKQIINYKVLYSLNNDEIYELVALLYYELKIKNIESI